MKIPKILTICLVVCCLFTGNALAQFHGISFLKQTENTAQIGDPVNVSFRILNNVDECLDTLEIYSLEDVLQTSSGPVSSNEILDILNWNFTGGAAWNDPVTRDYIIMPFGSSAQSDPYSYYNVQPGDYNLPDHELIDQANLGWTDTCEGGTGCGNCATNAEVASASGATTVLPPDAAVEVTKTACPYSKVGDTVTYDITIENIGGQDLTLNSVIDSLLGDITAAALAACPDPLPVGGSCNFQVLYEVQPGDDTGEPGAILVNIVTVNYTSSITQETIIDDDDAVVVLLHPSFTLDVECLEIVNGTALFQADFCNTGDVDLMVDPADPDIGDPFPLPVGLECVSFIIEVPAETGVCGAATASKTISALASIIMPPGTPAECQLGNIIIPVPANDTATCTVETNPCFDVTKTCVSGDTVLQDGELAEFIITIINCGDQELFFEVNDPEAGIINQGYGPLLPGAGPIEIPVSFTVECPGDGSDTIFNEVSVEGICVSDGSSLGIQTASAECPYECGGEEGCTPGFWKNHPDCWCDSYTPEMLVSDVFTALQDPNYVTLDDDDRKSDFDQDTLIDALKYRGGSGLAGSVRNLLRHATAALLNGCSDDVFYPVSDLIVIDLVNYVLATEDPAQVQELHSILAGFNEDYPCPINAHCERQEPTPE